MILFGGCREYFSVIRLENLSDTAAWESREHVQTVVKDAGLLFPRHRIVVNLIPAAVRKEGLSYDLPIAFGDESVAVIRTRLSSHP